MDVEKLDVEMCFPVAKSLAGNGFDKYTCKRIIPAIRECKITSKIITEISALSILLLLLPRQKHEKLQNDDKH